MKKELSEVFFYVDEFQNMFAVPLSIAKPKSIEEAQHILLNREFVVNLNSINPEFRSLLGSSLLMFHCLGATQAMLEPLQEMLDAAKTEIAGQIADVVGDAVASINVCRRAAVEGLENIIPPSK